ncbi:MAG: HIT domain-containing protein [Dehalococcoidia bacterium]|nr:HIT domain-containing protein [Dehalococcoidia bacterium]
MPCVFCEIVAKREPASIRYEDDDVIVIDNILRWAPVMLLAIPKRHISQQELWENMGSVGAAAIRVGEELCPNGYRLISNLGRDAMQSQPHGHIHILGGFHLGPYA